MSTEILKKKLEIAKCEGCIYQLEWDANKNPDGLDDEYYAEMKEALTLINSI